MSSSFKNKIDIHLILQLSRCLSATFVCKHNTFSMYDFMFMLHNSNSNKVKSLNLKTCKSINLQTTGYPYSYGQSLKKDEILDLATTYLMI